MFNTNSGRLLACHEGGKADGTPAIQFDDTGGADQKWKLMPGAGVIQYKFNGTMGTADQWWRFSKE